MDSVLRTDEPFLDAWCPMIYDRSSLIRRPFELEEMLRIFQFPLDMDKEFRRLKGLRDLPFLDNPSGEMMGVLLRQLWGESMGGLEQLSGCNRQVSWYGPHRQAQSKRFREQG